MSLYYLINDFFENYESNNLVEELKEEIIEKDKNTDKTLINWGKLKNINNDIIAWIEIDGTNINYPIMRDNKDSVYYINHTYNRKYNSNGSIFTIDKDPFKIQRTTIYGHNRKNGIMFYELVNYLNNDFFYSHRNIKIYTPKNNYKATVFSVYEISINTEKKNIESLSFEEEIEYYKKMSKYTISNTDSTQKIIKLITCFYNDIKSQKTDKRCIVIANLEKM